MRKRETCEFRDRCGRTGHYWEEGKGWVMCPCMEDEVNKRTLGQFYTPNILPATKLTAKLQENLILEGPLAELRKHVARALVELRKGGGTFEAFDAYRLVEIFLRQDDQFENQGQATLDQDLLILLVGFADIKNRMLPQLITQVLNRRSLLFKPTWVVLGIPYLHISTKYSVDVEELLRDFQRMKI